MSCAVFAALAILLCSTTAFAQYYNFNGAHAPSGTKGAANTALVNIQVTTVDATRLTNPDLPSARVVSLALSSNPNFKRRNSEGYTDLLTYYGQCIAHELINTPVGAVTAPIQLPANDPYWSATSVTVMKFNRSATTVVNGQTEHMNTVTAWLDGSLIYGSSDAVAQKLRTGQYGLMKVDAQGNLPFYAPSADDAAKPADNLKAEPPSQLRMAGDARVNQNPGRFVINNVWVREHNWRVDKLRAANPDWDDEKLFQRARQWTVAHFQRVTYYEYIPNVLGVTLPPYSYNASIDPGIDEFFASTSYRYGHAAVTPVIMRVDDNGNQIPEGHLPLLETWFRPTLYLSSGGAPLLRGLVAVRQGTVEPRWSDAIQHHLFGYGGVNGTDLVARNIQRGRDHGVPDYNTCRRAFGLAAVSSYAEITDNVTLQQQLQSLYGTDPGVMDPYIAGLVEKHLPGSHVGELFQASMLDQYTRTRNADYWWFENTQNGLFNDTELLEIQKTSFRDIIMRTYPDIKTLPLNVWRIEDETTHWPSNTTCAPTDGNFVSQLNGAVLFALAVKGDRLEVDLKTSASVQGWVGFGIGQDTTSRMAGADFIIVEWDGDEATATDCHSAQQGVKPVRDEDLGGGANNVLVLESARLPDGSRRVRVSRPLAASDAYDRAVLPDAMAVVLVAYSGDGQKLVASSGHASNRNLSQANPSTGATQSVTSTSAEMRVQHGQLMSSTFALLFPLGALLARCLRMSFIPDQVKAIMFYLHIGFQCSVAVIATAGFALAVNQFQTPVGNVPYGHGALGATIIALIYLQVVLGIIRPPANNPRTVRFRLAWEVMHTTVGRLAILLGVVNMSIGLYLLNVNFGQPITTWVALVASSLVLLALAQVTLDRLEIAAQAYGWGSAGAGDGNASPLKPRLTPDNLALVEKQQLGSALAAPPSSAPYDARSRSTYDSRQNSLANEQRRDDLQMRGSQV